MIAQEHIPTLYGREVYDRDGDKIGEVGAVWTDDSGHASWASVRTGLFGLNESLVPLQEADFAGDRLIVPFDKETVKDAPNVDADEDEPLDADEIARLYSHYAYQSGAEAGDDAMTRSEERLNVGTEREAAGRARLRKYVVTEHEQVRVPVTREEVTIDREPITDANRDDAYRGPAISEAEHEVTLHADRPVVDTEAVPVERVRLGKHAVTDHETVDGEVRKERIEAERRDF